MSVSDPQPTVISPMADQARAEPTSSGNIVIGLGDGSRLLSRTLSRETATTLAHQLNQILHP